MDIWRLETKVEVLMGEVLKTLAKEEEDEGVSHIQKVFNKSYYRHIHSIAKESKGLPTMSKPVSKPESGMESESVTPASNPEPSPQEETF